LVLKEKGSQLISRELHKCSLKTFLWDIFTILLETISSENLNLFVDVVITPLIGRFIFIQQI